MRAAVRVNLEQDAHSSMVGEATQRSVESVVSENLHLKVVASSIQEVLCRIMETNICSLIVHNVVRCRVNRGFSKIHPAKRAGICVELVDPLFWTTVENWTTFEVWQQ